MGAKSGVVVFITPEPYGFTLSKESGLYYLQSRYYNPGVGRFINGDDPAYLGVAGILSYNLFAYCKNIPVSASDPSGHFAFLSFLGAVVGGAIGGAAIATVSYVVGAAINGQEITGTGLINAVTTGAICGAVGGAIGTISLATGAATLAAKGLASVGVGIAMGIKSGIEAEGSSRKRVWTGISSGVITAGSTFLGSRIEAYDAAYGFAGNAFTSSAATLFVGAPAEIISVAAQQGISEMDTRLTRTKSPSYARTSGRTSTFCFVSAY